MRAVQSLGLRRSLTCLLGACHPGRWRVMLPGGGRQACPAGFFGSGARRPAR